MDEGDDLRAEQSPAPTGIWVEGVVVRGEVEKSALGGCVVE